MQKRDWICRKCNRESLNELDNQIVQQAVEKEKYTIKEARRRALPTITAKGDIPTEDVIFDMLEDTALYRIDQMTRLMKRESEPKALRDIVVYLLKSWDLLNNEQCAQVVNEANKYIANGTYDSNLRAKMANDLRAFMQSMQRTKGGPQEKSFESMLREQTGMIEVESPI